MSLIRCRCCEVGFDLADDTSPDTLIYSQDGSVLFAVLSTDLCYPCREGGPITHAMKHFEAGT